MLEYGFGRQNFLESENWIKWISGGFMALRIAVQIPDGMSSNHREIPN
jgi:hypothetical protein